MSNLKNKKMNDSTYALRKRVMSFVYEAKKLDPSLPRVSVRITDDHQRHLALATVGKKEIWVTEQAITKPDFDLRTIVFHEIVHACYGVRHDESCILMKSIHKPLSKSECEKAFMRYVRKGGAL